MFYRPGMTRRNLLASGAAFAAASKAANTGDKPALLGGKPVRTESFPEWPVIGDDDERELMEALRSRRWNRRGGRHVDQFERAWAARVGSRHALATNGGTSALFSALNALEVGPGDEVIVPPYTFIATINVVLLQHALPVFVDTDRETFQIDAKKIEAAITRRTRCIMPVHLGGASADMDAILAVARKHGIPVVEDACQSHLAEWKGKKVGTLGDIGCFSFQASKNLNCGEGGVLTTDDEELYGRSVRFHNNGGALGGAPIGQGGRTHGCNLRMTEFQGALLSTQMERVEKQMQRREENAAYLSRMLDEIPGVTPARMYDGCTRNAYHLYMFRYDAQAFEGLPRKKFIEATSAEGIPLSGGYRPLNKDPFLENTLGSRAFRTIFSEKDAAQWRERNSCPENDRLCEEALWIGQSRLLGPRSDMDQIAEAVRRVQKNAADIARS